MPNKPLESQGADDSLAGESMSFYWKLAVFPIFILLAGEIVLHYMDYPAYVTRIFEAVVFLIVGLLAAKRHKGYRVAAFAAAYTAVLAGILIVLFEFIIDAQVWRVFNLIARPMWMGVGGFVVGALSGILFMRILSSSLKGGGTHG